MGSVLKMRRQEEGSAVVVGNCRAAGRSVAVVRRQEVEGSVVVAVADVAAVDAGMREDLRAEEGMKIGRRLEAAQSTAAVAATGL